MVELTDPPPVEHGFVTGRFVTAKPDSIDDDGRYPDLRGMTGSCRFTPAAPIYLTEAAVVVEQFALPLNENGWLVDAESGEDQSAQPGAWLAIGDYDVEPVFPSARNFPKYRITVTDEHTKENPLVLHQMVPIVLPPRTMEITRVIDRQLAQLAAEESMQYAELSEEKLAQLTSLFLGGSDLINNEAVKTYVENEGPTRAALSAKYMAHVVWDGSAYPPRTPGGANIFVGPVNPGAAMNISEGDLWDNPDVTTTPQLLQELEDSNSQLANAVEAAATSKTRMLLTATALRPSAGGTPPTLTAQSSTPGLVPGGTVPVLSFAGGAIGEAAGSTVCPPGWSSARISLLFTPGSTPSGSVRWLGSMNQILVGGSISQGYVSSGEINTTPPDAAGKVGRVTFSATFPVTPGEIIRLTVGRRGDHASDTFTGDARLIAVQVERAS